MSSEEQFQRDVCENLKAVKHHTVVDPVHTSRCVFSTFTVQGSRASTLPLLSGICGFDNILLLKLSVLVLTTGRQNVSSAVPRWFEAWFAHRESTSDRSLLENVSYSFSSEN